MDIVWATQNKKWHDGKKEYGSLTFEW